MASDFKSELVKQWEREIGKKQSFGTFKSKLVSAYFNVAGIGAWQHPCPGNLESLPPRQLSQLIETCVADAVDWFISNYMKLRFEPYARAELGYSIAGNTFKKKRRQARTYADAVLPNVFTGETRDAVLSSARPVTRAIGGRTKARIGWFIKFNAPQKINQQSTQVTNKILRTITATEAQRMAQRFFELLEAAASRVLVEVTVTRGGALKTRGMSSSKDIANFGRSSRSTVLLQRRAGV